MLVSATSVRLIIAWRPSFSEWTFCTSKLAKSTDALSSTAGNWYRSQKKFFCSNPCRLSRPAAAGVP